MFYGRAEPETWGHLVTPDGKVYPLLHWECLIGRARSADITLPYADVANVHAVLMRNDAGEWTVSDLSRSGGVFLNGEQITEPTLLDAYAQIRRHERGSPCRAGAAPHDRGTQRLRRRHAVFPDGV